MVELDGFTVIIDKVYSISFNNRLTKRPFAHIRKRNKKGGLLV